MQRMHGKFDIHPFQSGVTLDTTFGNLPGNVQTAIEQTAIEWGYTNLPIPPSATLRVILKTAGDLWGARPIYFGTLGTL
jgi:hypothetical protein